MARKQAEDTDDSDDDSEVIEAGPLTEEAFKEGMAIDATQEVQNKLTRRRIQRRLSGKDERSRLANCTPEMLYDQLWKKWCANEKATLKIEEESPIHMEWERYPLSQFATFDELRKFIQYELVHGEKCRCSVQLFRANGWPSQKVVIPIAEDLEAVQRYKSSRADVYGGGTPQSQQQQPAQVDVIGKLFERLDRLEERAQAAAQAPAFAAPALAPAVREEDDDMKQLPAPPQGWTWQIQDGKTMMVPMPQAPSLMMQAPVAQPPMPPQIDEARIMERIAMSLKAELAPIIMAQQVAAQRSTNAYVPPPGFVAVQEPPPGVRLVPQQAPSAPQPQSGTGGVDQLMAAANTLKQGTSVLNNVLDMFRPKASDSATAIDSAAETVSSSAMPPPIATVRVGGFEVPYNPQTGERGDGWDFLLTNGASLVPELKDMLREGGRAISAAIEKNNESKRLELQTERLRAQHIAQVARIEQSKFDYERQRAANAGITPMAAPEATIEPEPELEPAPAPAPEPPSPAIDVAGLIRI